MKKFLKYAGLVLGLVFALTLGVTNTVKADETKISVNTVYNYTNNGEYDVDRTFRFVAPNNGYFTVSQTNLDSYGNSGNRLLVYNSDNEELDRITWSNHNQTTGVISATKGHTYYIKTAIDDHGGKLKLRVNFTKASDWETEDNDTPYEADKLTNKKWMYGVVNINDSHPDYFKIKVKKASYVKLTFGPKYNGVNCNFTVRIYNKDNFNSTLYSYSSNVTDKEIYLRKGTYYLQVTGSEEVPYKLRYKASALKFKQVRVRSVTKGYRGLFTSKYSVKKITLKNTSGVDGYQVQFAKKKNMKGRVALSEGEEYQELGTYTNSDTRSCIRRFSSNCKFDRKKTYYVRVRGYRVDPFGAKIMGKWSKPFKFKIK